MRKRARPPQVRTKIDDSSDDFYLKTVQRSDVQLLYQFIYGNKRHEIEILFNGFKKLSEHLSSPEEKRNVALLAKVTFDLWQEELINKQHRFEKRFKKPLHVVLKEAKNGNDQSLFKLIESDKSRLSESFVRERIQRAQAEEDTGFFYHLGEAVKRTKWKLEYIPGNKDMKQRNLRRFIRLLHIAGFNLSLAEATKKVLELVDKFRSEGGYNLPVSETSQVIERTLESMSILAAKK